MVGLSRTTVASVVESFVIITNDFKLLATVIKNSILDVSWVLKPSLYIELTNENCISSYKVHRFILEKINPCIQGIYAPYPVEIVTFMLFITINNTNHLMSWGQNIGIDLGIVCFNQLIKQTCSTLDNFPLATKFAML